MARRPDLERFAQEHGLKIGTIADLIRYRMETEKSVERVVECALPTEFGDFHLIAYKDSLDGNLHFAMVMGRIDPSTPMLVRVHLQNPICDLTGSLREDCGWPLRDALRRVAQEGAGVVVILSNQVEPLELINQLRAYADQNGTYLSAKKQNTRDLRTIGLGAQILSDVGVRKMRVLSAPKRMHAISGFGLEVIEYVN